MRKVCDNCEHFDEFKDDSGAGHCIAHPPKVFYAPSLDDGSVTLWPVLYALEGCGEFTPREDGICNA